MRLLSSRAGDEPERVDDLVRRHDGIEDDAEQRDTAVVPGERRLRDRLHPLLHRHLLRRQQSATCRPATTWARAPRAAFETTAFIARAKRYWTDR